MCRSRSSKVAGNPKKGGHGGKFTWHGGKGPDLGVLDNEVDGDGLDAGDPNYDSEDEHMLLPRGHAEELAAYKAKARAQAAGVLQLAASSAVQLMRLSAQVTALVEEYFNSGDLAEAAASLKVHPCRLLAPGGTAARLGLKLPWPCRMPGSRSCTTGSSSER